MSLDAVSFLSAEIVLVVTALAIYMGGAFSKSQKVWAPLAMLGIVLAAVALSSCGSNERYLQEPVRAMIQNAQGGMISTDDMARQIADRAANSCILPDHLSAYGRWLALAIGAVVVLMAWRPLATGGTAEYLGSLLLIVAGLMLVASAGNLVLLFLGLELISIPTYIILPMGRRDAASQESAAKYFFLSVLASAILLYGLTFVYGTTGSMQLDVIRQKLLDVRFLPDGFELFAKLGLVLVIAGLCFRVTAVPFHFYAPDVYQGTIQANAGLLSVLPKAAGLLALVRIVLFAMPDMGPFAWKVLLAISVLTMTLGNVVALWQDNVRRLFAYSSIANAGYMLIGLSVALAMPHTPALWNGIGATFFYLCVYTAATLGGFAVFAYLGRHRQQIETVEELAGLGRTHPAMAASLAVCMFSLAGLPPAAGLWGKLLVFGSALNVQDIVVQGSEGSLIRPWFIALAIIGMLNAAIAAYYYLRIISAMYFREPLATPRAEGGSGPYLAALVCSFMVLVFFIFPGPLMKRCVEAGSRELTSEVLAQEALHNGPHPIENNVALNPPKP